MKNEIEVNKTGCKMIRFIAFLLWCFYVTEHYVIRFV